MKQSLQRRDLGGPPSLTSWCIYSFYILATAAVVCGLINLKNIERSQGPFLKGIRPLVSIQSVSLGSGRVQSQPGPRGSCPCDESTENVSGSTLTPAITICSPIDDQIAIQVPATPRKDTHRTNFAVEVLPIANTNHVG
jgi:hypothetical protein